MMKTAVIADDSLVMRGRFCAAVTLAGGQVIGQACNAAEAFELCVEHQPDLVILDYNMPPGDGGDVAREIIENQLASKVLVVSSNSQDAIFGPLRQLGAYTLTKPCEDPELYAEVKAMLDGSA